jgi:hypothetical protein
MRKIEATAAAAGIAMAGWGSMTAIASLRHETGSADQAPLSAAATTARPFVDSAAASPPSLQDVCKDLEFAFVHSRCVKTHKKKHVARSSHRLATLVIGSAAAPLSLPIASMRSATASQGLMAGGGAAAQEEPRAGNDHVAERSSDPNGRVISRKTF